AYQGLPETGGHDLRRTRLGSRLQYSRLPRSAGHDAHGHALPPSFRHGVIRFQVSATSSSNPALFHSRFSACSEYSDKGCDASHSRSTLIVTPLPLGVIVTGS